MRVGLHIGRFDWAGGPAAIPGTLAAIATEAEQAGFESLWVMDHLNQLGTQYGKVHGPVDGEMLEAYTTLSFLAGVTEQIRLGALVTCAFFRPPGLLVKQATALDVLAGGRTYLGLGAGWFEQEAVGLGIPFPRLRERFDRLEDALQVARRMWSGDASPFQGHYSTLLEPVNSPPPLAHPHPPILVGGVGERRTLPLVARYADAWNAVIGSPLDHEDFGVLRKGCNEGSLWWLGRKVGALERCCDAIGRPPSEIERTVTTYIRVGEGGMGAADVVALCSRFAELGFSHVIFNILEVDTLEPLRILGRDVIPEVRLLS